jgi:UDP-N-acetylglucosamine 2-epimerase (non-hydrolysing)
MPANLRVLRQFIDAHEDLTLIFPVHPNPFVVKSAEAVLSGHPRIHLLQPLRYEEFILLLSHAWLIVSDSGGIQEEAPTLGKPLLILRENTERPEAVEAGVAKLVGKDPDRLAELLKQVHSNGVWSEGIKDLANPFGRGDSGERIAEIISGMTRHGKIGGYCPGGSNLTRTPPND